MDNSEFISAEPFPDLPKKRKERKKEIRQWFSLWFNIQEPNKYTRWKSALFHSPDFDKECLVQTDASDIRLESQLSLIMKERKHPVMYTCKKLLKGKLCNFLFQGKPQSSKKLIYSAGLLKFYSWIKFKRYKGNICISAIFYRRVQSELW